MTREERNKKIVESYERGDPVADTARRAGLTQEAIYYILKKNGIKPNRKSPVVWNGDA